MYAPQSSQQPATSMRASKRKRAQVNYYEGDPDAEDADSEDDQVAEGQSRLKKQKTVRPPKPLPKSKIFPFLELPAEIRNIIYDYCLTDPRGVYLVSSTRSYRKTVARAGPWYMEEVYNEQHHGQRQHQPRQRRHWFNGPLIRQQETRAATEDDELKDFLTKWRHLVPALLAVNKQIYTEGRDILYGNEFKFDSTLTLHSFMVIIGHRAATLLTHVTLRSWDMGRGVHKAYNHASFSMMMSATNIQEFRLEAQMNYGYGRARHIASQLYRDAFPWLDAVGVAKGKVDAAVDVIRVSKLLLSGGRKNYREDDFKKDEKEFKEELSRLLVDYAAKMRPRSQPKPKPAPKANKRAEREMWD